MATNRESRMRQGYPSSPPGKSRSRFPVIPPATPPARPGPLCRMIRTLSATYRYKSRAFCICHISSSFIKCAPSPCTCHPFDMSRPARQRLWSGLLALWLAFSLTGLWWAEARSATRLTLCSSVARK
ncbi:hypothetical protein LHGZ1_3011 [Laribacter hongkongensis]|uniref:Uncharacterized protein n=1 Tax=Laribacter hongkongensis TaxID=168471 RepID=A0A248LMF1_9NEIS|nr:hypothetical protein LHGZ1_3011 [Laribacter hongkongensis]